MTGRKWMRSLPHTVYILTDAEGEVLYVGMSIDAERRIYQHRSRSKGWFGFVAYAAMETYPNWESAKHVEGVRITKLEPIHNIQREAWAASHRPTAYKPAIAHWEMEVSHGG